MTAQLRIHRDPQIQKFCLDLIILAIESGESRRLVDAGLDAALLDEIRDLKSYEIARLIQMDLGFGLVVHQGALAHQIGVLKHRLHEQRLVEMFIARGCPTPLAIRLFKLQKRDVLAYRLSLGVSNPASETQPSPAKRRIEESWLAYRPTHFNWLTQPVGERLRAEIAAWKKLMEAFPHTSLMSLYQVVVRFERCGAEEKQA